MPANDTARLNEIKRKVLAMGTDSVQLRGETKINPLADDLKRVIGQAIDRAIVLAGLTKQDVAFRMGYADQSALARWIAGVETPQFAKLFVVVELRGPLVIALAEIADDATVVTEIRISRRGVA